MMKALIAAALVTGSALVASAPAEARQGCGPGYHRGAYGRCVANFRGRGPAYVVGRYYNGRGYWDGRRWYQNRYRHHGGWRYR
jgi:hypothetical protein